MQAFMTYVFRLITAPFFKLLRALKNLGNLNVILRKVTKPIIAAVQNTFKIRPKKWEDYFVIGNWFVAKKVILLFILLICAVPVIYLSKFAPDIPSVEALNQEGIIFQYDDIKLKDYSGRAVIKAESGQIVYQGDIVKGICTGKGKVYDLRGKLVYEGELKENAYCGMGKLYSKDGQLIYEGSFSNNMYNGIGILYDYKGQRRYEGSFADSLKEGKGKVFNAKNEIIYEGDFSKDLYNGVGILHNKMTGEWYEGAFENGKKQGAGILYNNKNEKIFEGTYAQDFFDGDCKRYYKSKLIYAGAYKAGKKEGKGKEFNADGKLVYEGDFVLGLRHGQGVLYDGVSDRKVYEGGFFQGKRQGQGILYDIAGKEMFAGKIFNDGLDYSAYLDENMQVIESVFKEKPKLIYKEQKSYFLYPELGIILITDFDVNAFLAEQTASTASEESKSEETSIEDKTSKEQTSKEDKTSETKTAATQNVFPNNDLEEALKNADKTKMTVNAVIVLKNNHSLQETKAEREEAAAVQTEDCLSIWNLQQKDKTLLSDVKLTFEVKGENMLQLIDESAKVNVYKRIFENGKLQNEAVYKDKKDSEILYYIMRLKKG